MIIRKSIKFFSLILILLLCLSFLSLSKIKAFTPLDIINLYDITVDTRDDATLDIKMYIEWKVLDSSSEGPLSWVRIGVPNYHCDDYKALSDNIDYIKYSNEGGAYLEIYFKKNYYAGEVVKFSFSFHQAYMFYLENIDEENETCRFYYVPGWFDEIEVSKFVLRWKDDNVLNVNTKLNGLVIDGYKTYETQLNYREKVEFNFYYLSSNFPNIDKGKTYTASSSSKFLPIIVFIIVASFFDGIIILGIIHQRKENEYEYNRGFIAPRRTYFGNTYFYINPGRNSYGDRLIPTSHSTASHGGTSSCACACACACAGGGRAGCSKKDFYNSLDVSNYKKRL